MRARLFTEESRRESELVGAEAALLDARVLALDAVAQLEALDVSERLARAVPLHRHNRRVLLDEAQTQTNRRRGNCGQRDKSMSM